MISEGGPIGDGFKEERGLPNGGSLGDDTQIESGIANNGPGKYAHKDLLSRTPQEGTNKTIEEKKKYENHSNRRKPEEKLTGFSPDKPGFTARTKQHWLETLSIKSKENPTGYKFPEERVDTAAILMEAFSAGRDYVHKRFQELGFPVEVPQTFIITKKDFLGSGAGAVDNGSQSYLGVDAAYLEQMSNFPPDELWMLKTADGTVDFIVKIADYFELTGVEEAHHDIYYQLRGAGEQQIRPGDTSLANYDAQDHEWLALYWQKKYAKETGMPEVTIEVLTQRLEAANAVRRQKKNPPSSKET